MSDTQVKIGMKPPHPGSFIREEILDELGLSIARAAEILGVRRATLSDLLNRKAALSAEMALRIEKAFGVDMDTLLRMQAWYDSYVMRERAGEIDVQRFNPNAFGSAREG
ncbi:MAG TPA: HigA family addiction module antitoxin [Stellaceae bacterium]|nr:HigA family addiction module antitoxin [Stellaceae bacterium]